MDVSKKVIEPKKVIPEVAEFNIRVRTNELHLLSFGLMRALEDRLELTKLKTVPGFLGFSNDTKQGLKQMLDSFETMSPRNEEGIEDNERYTNIPAKHKAEPVAHSVEEMLKIIVEFLNRDDLESRQLWHVLTALRGPDKCDDNKELLKKSTTCVIRTKIGLNKTSPSNYGPNGAMVYADTEDGPQVRMDATNRTSGVSPHFISHAELAFEVLGLAWKKKNE
jgi:hypothetical protein